MTTELNDTLPHASEIIERFGGIRPMANKTGIPVTTIQGWKQRNAIPINRRDDIITAANTHKINLSDLLMDIMSNDIGKTPREEIVITPDHHPMRRKQGADPDTRPANNQNVYIGAGILMAVAAILGIVIAVAPDVKQASVQEQRIAELEQQIESMKNILPAPSAPLETTPYPQTASAKPSGWMDKISSLEGQIGTLTEQAKTYGAVIDDLQTGTMDERLAKLEGHVGQLADKAKTYSFQDVMQKIQLMQSSPEGLGQVDGLIALFVGSAQQATPDTLAQNFEQLRASNPDVASTFKDVAPEDMKAAVMLMGMAQMRQSLMRNNDSFDQDLQLLKMTLAKDNPELQAAIDKLAPKAKQGVLTPDGLSRELRGLTGEIVAAELSGQDVSIEDKLKARLGQMVTVEKNGQQVSGTPAQKTIAEAQKKLDAGDVAGAVALLQTIQGPASSATLPFINQANATLMAQQVQTLLGQNLMLKLKTMGTSHIPYTAHQGGLKGLANEVNRISSGLGYQP